MISWRFRTYTYWQNTKQQFTGGFYNRGNLPIRFFEENLVQYLDQNPNCIGVALKEGHLITVLVEVDREYAAQRIYGY